MKGILIHFLCTRGAYYVRYCCLLISNKFCNGGEWPEQGGQAPLCTCSSTPLSMGPETSLVGSLSALIDAISQGPKNSRIPGPNPLPLALVINLHASKTSLCMGCINHRCINSYICYGSVYCSKSGSGFYLSSDKALTYRLHFFYIFLAA
jgi:hypothetical protein